VYDWRQDVTGPAKRADQPQGKLKYDLIISTITPVEGCNAAALYVDDHSGLRWLYDLKSKDDALAASKRWMAEISELLEKYPLFVVMRENAGENKSKEISEYFTFMGVKNYFSTAY
jgi:hypothetical protein